MIVGMAVLVALLAALAVLATVEKGQSSPASSSVPAPLATGTALSQPRKVPPIELIDDQGKPFSLSQWRGKWVVLAPSLTLCHEVCPMTTGALTELTNEIQRAGLGGR